MKSSTGSKRCWNCRSRKTACDRTQPSCVSCQRRGVECLGYGLRLSWPRLDDDRRAAKGHQHRILPVRAKTLGFVNATDRDVEVSLGSSRQQYYLDEETEASARVQPPLRGLGSVTLAHVDPFLATRGYSAVGPIISTACVEMPELYHLLVRMSLAEETPSALAARHAIAAVSYQHLGDNKAATLHQSKSLSALQVAINSLSSGVLEATQALGAIAASMLLNIFETLIFDGTSYGWAVFFCGCKRIVNLWHTPQTTYEGDQALILDWVFYHDTMYKFSIRHWYSKQQQQILLAKQQKIISKASYSPMRQLILPSTGCSLELLSLLCQVVDAVHDRSDPHHLSPAHLRTLHNLEQRLSTLTQVTRITSATTSEVNPHRHTATTLETLTAELYRLATLIYLHRVARASPQDDPAVLPLVDMAMQLLAAGPGVGVGSSEEGQQQQQQAWCCPRPWPLFILALEARTEDERRLVSGALDAAMRARPLGNVGVVRRLVCAAWVQMDFKGAEGGGGGDVDVMEVYNTVVSGLRMPPSFT